MNKDQSIVKVEDQSPQLTDPTPDTPPRRLQTVSTLVSVTGTTIAVTATHVGPWAPVAIGFAGVVTWLFCDVAVDAVRVLIWPDHGAPLTPLLMQRSARQIAESIRDVPERPLHPDQSFLARVKRLVNVKPTSTEDAEPVGSPQFSKRVATASPSERISLARITQLIERNSYTACLGTSLKSNPRQPVVVNFKKQHFKFIGASQKGKSSMIAAFLTSLINTHDNQHVRIALLDLEDRTSNLFADSPHILMHARSVDEVADALEKLVEHMDERYRMTLRQIKNLPLILVYVEEFYSLKKRLKVKDKDKYQRVVWCISELACRGLKAGMQLLLCAQTDYADEDFRDAIANVTNGMAFCLKPTAAGAAGFLNTELLTENASAGKVGQAVLEMPGIEDIVLAPHFDLEAELIALEEEADEIPDASPEAFGAWEFPDLPMGPFPKVSQPLPEPFPTFPKASQGNGEDSPRETFEPQGDDKLFDSLQAELFVVHYRHTGTIVKALESMSLGKRYYRHAKHIVESLKG